MSVRKERSKRTKNANASNAFFRMEFILGHDDIYQKFYWYLLLSDGFQLNAFLSEHRERASEERLREYYTLKWFSDPTNFCRYKHVQNCKIAIHHHFLSLIAFIITININAIKLQAELNVKTTYFTSIILCI